MLKIRSWNVNGLRAIMRKGFGRWLTTTSPDIVGVQEVRAHQDQLDDEVKKLAKRGYHVAVVSAHRKGYSGVAIVSKEKPDDVVTTLHADFDDEGRVVMARFGKLLVVNVYVPNGNGKQRDNSRVPYKLAFSRALYDALERERRNGGRVVVMGDINTAPYEIDLARPKQNTKTSGFLPEERAELVRWLESGWTDTFRVFEPGPGHYSWWSSRFGVREKNIGWRIDLVLASEGALPFVRGALIEK